MIDKTYEINVIMLISISILLIVRSLDQDISNKSNLQLQLAAFVTVIASMHYFLMTQSSKKVVHYRYFDWFFTTPILLIDLCLILGITDFYFISELVFYNTLMLLFGYLGEINVIPLIPSNILGFVPFVLMYKKIIDKIDTQEKKNITNAFFGLWTLYGVNQLNTNSNSKNIIYNVLDFITKGAFGLYIYYESF